MTWYLAKTYEKDQMLCEPFDNEKGRKVVKIKHPCERCFGTGNYGPLSVNNGYCFECGGRGYVILHVRAYTEKEKAALDRAEVRRQEKAEEKRQAELRKKEADSEKNKIAWYQKHGFTENGQTWLIGGGNTFNIKDEIKEKGGKFDQILKWHFDHDVTADFPDYKVVSLSFDDVYEWNCYRNTAEAKDGAVALVETKLTPAINTISDYVGQCGDRLRDISAVVTSHFSFEGAYGQTNVFRFEDEKKNVYTWFTSTSQSLQIGDPCLLTGTVKEHKEYKGEKQTILSRCKIKVG